MTSVMCQDEPLKRQQTKAVRSQLVKLSDVQENSKSKALPGNGPRTLEEDSEESCGWSLPVGLL